MPLNDRKHAKSGSSGGGVKPENRKASVLLRVRNMKVSDREDLFDELLSIYCLTCANVLEPGGRCPNEDCESNEIEEDDEDDDGDDDDDDGDDADDSDDDDSGSDLDGGDESNPDGVDDDE